MTTNFDVNAVSGVDGEVSLVASGELDLASAQALTDAVGAAADGGEQAVVSIDLGGVTFIDSTGVGALIRIRNAAEAEGGHLIITAHSRAVGRAVRLAGVADILGLDA